MQTVLERPADSLDSRSANLATQEANRRKALITLARLRRQARDEIDRLIRFLDESDLDPDLENSGDDEPSLGWCVNGGGLSGVEDLEAGDEDDEDGDPAEDSDSGIGDLDGLAEQTARHAAANGVAYV